MSVRQICCALAIFVACGSAARAGVIVTVGSISLTAGSLGWVPVYLSSDSGIIDLASTNFEFQITTAGSTRLDFMSSPDPAHDPTFSDSKYVFFNNSGDQTLGVPLGGMSTVNAPNDTFIGSDSYTGSGNVSVPITSPILTDNLLLAYLPVTTLTSLPPTKSDAFTISLVPSMSGAIGNPTGLDGNTGFADSEGNYYSFTSTPGTVTILAPSVVPEPASFGLMLAGVIGMLAIRRRKCAPHSLT